MPSRDLVRPSRDGDQFHYNWAARLCLRLLADGDLRAVSIEGPSALESDAAREEGSEVIDVGLYFGSERIAQASGVRYQQLKHSTRHAEAPWTASGLETTIRGFAKRLGALCAQGLDALPSGVVSFEFATNRPLDEKVSEALEDLRARASPRHPALERQLIDYTGLDDAGAKAFFRAFAVSAGEPDLWEQRSFLSREAQSYLADADADGPVRLRDLVARKASSEGAPDPSIRRHDVLRALGASDDDLFPAPCLIASPDRAFERAQEMEIRAAISSARGPLVLHADGGVGKSTLAARLAAELAEASVAIVYDCFGEGLYRGGRFPRHRHQDALVQIANELASRGLCDPLVPTPRAQPRGYLRAFEFRLRQAAGLLRARDPDAMLWLIVDAADNASIAAEDRGELNACFGPDLIRTPMPEGVKLVLTCRSHRRWRLGAPPDTLEIELRPFDADETARHLRTTHPTASDADAREFARLSNSNPRVQALALTQGATAHEMLALLGPAPRTVDDAIAQLLDKALAHLKDQAGNAGAREIDLICRGLTVLRPPIPLAVLAAISQTSEGAVRSFAADLGRSILVKGGTLHFRDEPTETWFRQRFEPDSAGWEELLGALRPLAAGSGYAAASLPPLLLKAGRLDELVALALSGEALPAQSPLERRDIHLQRLRFALRACLGNGRLLQAAKLALMAGAECAGESRQNKLIQENTDIAGALLGPDRIEEIVARRVFESTWMGSRHAYDAGLLCGRPELIDDARSSLRMANQWFEAWAGEPRDEKSQREDVDDADRAELALAKLRLRGPASCADFLRRWTDRRIALTTGAAVARRLIDLGDFGAVDELSRAAGNDAWLLLGISTELNEVRRCLPEPAMGRLLRLLSDRRVKLESSQHWTLAWDVLWGVAAVVEMAIRSASADRTILQRLLRRYLPDDPPRAMLSEFDEAFGKLLWCYALEARLRGETLRLIDAAPSEMRPELEGKSERPDRERTRAFRRDANGALPWFVLAAERLCGGAWEALDSELERALSASESADAEAYHARGRLSQIAARAWLRLLADDALLTPARLRRFEEWLKEKSAALWPDTLVALCRFAARHERLRGLAFELGATVRSGVESSREDANSDCDRLQKLARAIFTASASEAAALFNRAVEIASGIGDENLARWAALLNLADSAGRGARCRPESAYRLARAAELTYKHVARDKHFDWRGTVEALASLSGASAFAILSRWRDRRFGWPADALATLVESLVKAGSLPALAPVALSGTAAPWRREASLRHAVMSAQAPADRARLIHTSYRYLRVMPPDAGSLAELASIASSEKVDLPDLARLLKSAREAAARVKPARDAWAGGGGGARDARADWDAIFADARSLEPSGFRAAFEATRRREPRLPGSDFYREGFIRAGIGKTPELISEVARWPDFGAFDLRSLLDALPGPLPNMISLRAALREATLAAARREPDYFEREGFNAFLPLARLEAEGVASGAEISKAQVDGYAERADSLGPQSLFKLIQPLALLLPPDEADEALRFGLDLLEPALREDDGDGPWCKDLDPPGDCVDALAGYVWAGLGSPVVAERWEFAHAARTAVELGWTELVEALGRSATGGTGGPFVDRRLPFYLWHAWLWLLIGIARGAQARPAAAAPLVPLLLEALASGHVLLRAHASRALESLVAGGALDHAAVGDLGSVNAPALPEAMRSGWSRGPEPDSQENRDAAADGASEWHFGIDIGPYWIAPLGERFGLSQRAVERRVARALEERFGQGFNETEDARMKRGVLAYPETRHSHGSLPKVDDLRAYQAFHGLMWVAAQLLRDLPVGKSDKQEENDFDEWVERFSLTSPDGAWLADRRDPSLAPSPEPPESHRDEQWAWRVDRAALDQQLITDDGLLALWGHWSNGDKDDHETVDIESALVSREKAQALLRALQGAPELRRFHLPASDDDRVKLETAPFTLTGWVADLGGDSRLDGEDPWAEGMRYPGPAPCAPIVQQLSLAASPDQRLWSSGHGDSVRSETWTRSQGYGRDAATVPGWRLSANREFVARLLDARPTELLILSVSIRRRPLEDHDEKHALDRYPMPYARYYLLDRDGEPRALG